MNYFCYALGGNVLEVSIAGLDVDLYLGMEVCDHMHLGTLFLALFCQNVYKHADVRVSGQLCLQKIYEALEVLKLLFRDHLLVINTVRVIFEQIARFCTVHQL